MPINKENIEQKTKENIKKQFKEKTNDKIITIKNNKIIAYLKSKYGWNLKKFKDITDETNSISRYTKRIIRVYNRKKFPGKIKKIHNIRITDLNKKYKMSEIEAILLYLELKQNPKLAKSKIDELNLKLLNAKNSNY